MTAIYEFHMFYVNLLADAATLQLVFRELSDIPSDDVEEFWKEKLPRIQTQFDNMEISCEKRFPKSAAEEIKQDIDANNLFKILQTTLHLDFLCYTVLRSNENTSDPIPQTHFRLYILERSIID